MAMFAFKDLDKTQALELMILSKKLAAYSNAASFFGLPVGKWGSALSPLSGDFFANRFALDLPESWRALSPEELNLPASAVDRFGYYTVASGVTGDRPLNGSGPQLHILGQFDPSGKAVRLAISFAGTNDLLDVADYFQINEGKIAAFMNPALNAVKAYAAAHNLGGDDVVVTGYSLGGAMVNILAKYRNELADGFFDRSYYVGHASPLIHDDGSVFNMGFDNDAVYRIVGDAPTFGDAFALMNAPMSNTDTEYQSSVDNVALFTATYGSFLYDSKNPWATSILNPIQGWAAHMEGLGSDAIERIGESVFYDFMQKDSRVVVDQLNALSRPFMRVRDKGQDAGAGAFLIGSDRNNLLQDNVGNDYIDAKAGDDRVFLSYGVDRVDGGEGADTVVLQGKLVDWAIYRLSDGQIFAHHDQYGLKQLANVEKLSFAGEVFGETLAYSIGDDALYGQSLLQKQKHTPYKTHQEGAQHDDALLGDAVFALDGDDTLLALSTSSLLHGGEGDDRLFGGAGDDTLIGAEGRDYLYGGAGNNRLYGGIGDDVFAFDRQSDGVNTVYDFNQHAGDNDALVFGGGIFTDRNDVFSHAQASGKDVLIQKDSLSVWLAQTDLDALLGAHIVVL